MVSLNNNQILVGVTILIKSRYNINNSDHHKTADMYNNLTLWLVFTITAINVFIGAFGIDPNLPERLAAEKSYLTQDNVTNINIAH